MSQENKINQSCWGSIQKTTGTVEEKANCPKCHKIGEKVKNITVKHMVSENLMGKFLYGLKMMQIPNIYAIATKLQSNKL